MALTFTVGGARGTFEDRFADEVAEVLDHAFAHEGEWEGSPTLHYGELADTGWSDLQRRAIDELGADAIPNLTAAGRRRSRRLFAGATSSRLVSALRRRTAQVRQPPRPSQ